MLLKSIYEVALGPNYEAVVYEHPTKMWKYFPNYSNLITCWVYIDRL